MFGSAESVSRGESVPLGGGDDLLPAITHGDPVSADTLTLLVDGVGVVGSPLSLGLRGGLFRSLPEELPCEPRDSSAPAGRLSPLSRTPSADFLRTSPAASRAVVARCMMLTLPERAFRPFDPWSLSLSFMLLPGVDGPERMEISAIDGVGDKSALGDFARGGVLGRAVEAAIGVAGMSCSSGADTACVSAAGMGLRVGVSRERRSLPSFSFDRSGLRDSSRRACVMSSLGFISCGDSVTSMPDDFAPSSARRRSAFRFSIHHSAPVASHASLRTEWTICPVSKPRALIELRRSRSSGVEKIIGAGVLSTDEKSCGRTGAEDLSKVGVAGSDSVDDTERRFVRAGVRVGRTGGVLEELDIMLELCRCIAGRVGVSSRDWSTSRTSAAFLGVSKTSDGESSGMAVGKSDEAE